MGNNKLKILLIFNFFKKNQKKQYIKLFFFMKSIKYFNSFTFLFKVFLIIFYSI